MSQPCPTEGPGPLWNTCRCRRGLPGSAFREAIRKVRGIPPGEKTARELNDQFTPARIRRELGLFVRRVEAKASELAAEDPALDELDAFGCAFFSLAQDERDAFVALLNNTEAPCR